MSYETIKIKYDLQFSVQRVHTTEQLTVIRVNLTKIWRYCKQSLMVSMNTWSSRNCSPEIDDLGGKKKIDTANGRAPTDCATLKNQV